MVGAGDLVDHPKKIARHYLFGYFLIDLFVVLPLPQVRLLLLLDLLVCPWFLQIIISREIQLMTCVIMFIMSCLKVVFDC